MPNWCNNGFAIYGEAKEVKRLQEYLQYREMNIIKFANEYLDDDGSIMQHFDEKNKPDLWLVYVFHDLIKKHKIDIKQLNARGYITYGPDVTLGNDPNDVMLKFDCDSAWSPCNELIEAILNKEFPTLSMVYIAEEPGCGLFINSDRSGDFFSDRYRIDDPNGDGSEYFSSLKDMQDYIVQTYNGFDPYKYVDVTSLENDLNKYNKKFLPVENEGDLTVIEFAYE